MPYFTVKDRQLSVLVITLLVYSSFIRNTDASSAVHKSLAC